MYQDSGLFLRGGSGVGFAARRMERRMEQGVAATRAWRTRDGAVLRLLPDRLATLAAEVKAAVPPGHPAAADPHTAVREHVAALARAARPAGALTDHATGRALHVFRAPGRVGEMEIVTTPPRGPVFDIVEVRPAGGVNSEMEIYQDLAPGYQDAAGNRVRGPRVDITWHGEELGAFVQNPGHYPDAVYVLSLVDSTRWDPGHPNLLHLHRPRYIGQTAELAERWAANRSLMRALGGNPQAPFAVWIGLIQPNPGAGPLRFFFNPNAANQQPMELLRRDTEHVLIRSVNHLILGYNAAHPLVQPPMLYLTNQRSIQQVRSAAGVPGVPADPGGIDVNNNMGPHMIRPWFLLPTIGVLPGLLL